jgi:hypothetical protein
MIKGRLTTKYVLELMVKTVLRKQKKAERKIREMVRIIDQLL